MIIYYTSLFIITTAFPLIYSLCHPAIFQLTKARRLKLYVKVFLLGGYDEAFRPVFGAAQVFDLRVEEASLARVAAL